jgi:hypothetical protein
MAHFSLQQPIISSLRGCTHQRWEPAKPGRPTQQIPPKPERTVLMVAAPSLKNRHAASTAEAQTVFEDRLRARGAFASLFFTN